jgi:predicted membrane GTPase involved in stress response
MAVWLRKLIVSFEYAMNGPIKIKEDNQGAITYSKSLERTGRMKHIDVNGDEKVKIEFVSSSENVADIMTKTLEGKPFHKKK